MAVYGRISMFWFSTLGFGGTAEDLNNRELSSAISTKFSSIILLCVYIYICVYVCMYICIDIGMSDFSLVQLLGRRWDYIEYDNKILKDMDRMDAFRRALTTWAKWVDSDVDTTKSKVIFQGVSPSHYK